MSLLIYPSLQQPVPLDPSLTDFESGWHKQWEDPNLWSKVKAGFAIALIASGPQFNPLPLPNIAPQADRYGYNFSEPVREKIGLKTALQPSFTIDPTALTRPENITVASWTQPLSEPKRFPQRLLEANQPVFAFQPTPIINISWFAELSKPQRLTPPLLPVPEQHVFEFEPTPIIDISWFMPMSEPKRFGKRLQESSQPFFSTGAHALGTPYARGYVIC